MTSAILALATAAPSASIVFVALFMMIAFREE
jgi:hypothetical protein